MTVTAPPQHGPGPAAEPRALPRRSDFPAQFRWGCSTSSYQIEGAIREDGRGESIWDRFCETPGNIRDGSSGAVACDHYRRWRGDLDLARSLGLDAYRFSIAWPRILPQGRGEPNPKGLDFYSRLVDGILERGMEPWPTLYHWDLPQRLEDRGGWAERDTASAFAEFAETILRRLGDRVRHWITHNEPWCTAIHGYLEGVHAPGRRDLAAALRASHHVLLSHGLALQAIRAAAPSAAAGIALSLHPLKPASASAADAAAVTRHDGLRNRWFLDPLYGRGYPRDAWRILGEAVPEIRDGDLETIAAPTDFLGINYYFPEIVANAPGEGPLGIRIVPPGGAERTGFGWEVSPEGMVALLERVHRDYHPRRIILTENGSTYEDVVAADGTIDDEPRRRYLERHLVAARSAIAAGVPLEGYFAWSLLDNFEWAEGYARRFGLVHVDFATQKRTLKRSGQWFRAFLAGRDG